MSRVGDRVSDKDHPEPIEDVFDGQVEHPLTLGDCGDARVGAETEEEVFKAGGELEVVLAVDELRGERRKLVP